MSSSIKRVAIAGATGRIGPTIAQKLIDSGKFQVTVLRRQGSTGTVLAGAQSVDVDFESVDSVTAALAGHDAVISTLPASAPGVQERLVDASVAAGVQRFIPSEFGNNVSNPLARKNFAFRTKAAFQDYVIEKSKVSTLTYTFFYNGPFLDWCIENGLFFTKEGQPIIIDDGNSLFSTTTLASVGDGIVGVLSHPEETRNRPVFVQDIQLSQNKLLELAKVAFPDRNLEPKHIKLDEALATAGERVAKGIIDIETFLPYLYQTIVGPEFGTRFEKTDNALFGMKGKTESDVVDIIKKAFP